MNGAKGGIGVLDLQGGVWEHIDHLDRIGVAGRRVKQAADLDCLAGLIIPGGESTCMSRLLRMSGLRDTIIRGHRDGMKIWGTCAGAILLANRIVGEDPCLGLIDIDIARNSFGSQLDSFIDEAIIPGVADDPVPLVFIRAPKIIRIGAGVQIIHQGEGYIAAAETPDVLVTVFHPELTGSTAFHRYFCRKCGVPPSEIASSGQNSWDHASWTRFTRVG